MLKNNITKGSPEKAQLSTGSWTYKITSTSLVKVMYGTLWVYHQAENVKVKSTCKNES